MEISPVQLEELVHEKIKEAGDEGIAQTELATALGVSNKELSSALKKLILKRLVLKRSMKVDGKNVVKLFAVARDYSRIVVNVKSMHDVPCFTCNILSKCGNGSQIGPHNCPKLASWLISQL
ncbi:hypothetical protein HS1genome_1044 [Sulfodiicoccus acidiphilus]|uniref:Winged helix-turn-helix domain-containing protein n=1 Tax=Sulfodiicoccus acidiphilus TaxID=1670455 RepID=A0A348B3A3_9CREN|nr:winged helix-turn-helix domain-containing protein [Sulfodiicoccus acidiphilus]BBD72655.1 hypothetical protein HS1genome_1044 [Sulfodiicoccus acidiphilus]GGT95663.1 hypothetical protein GCM10007116_11600 [Sulfodiicoccus acidiphilus]